MVLFLHLWLELNVMSAVSLYIYIYINSVLQGELSRSATQPQGQSSERAALVRTVPGPLSSTISMQEHGADPELVCAICRLSDEPID